MRVSIICSWTSLIYIFTDPIQVMLVPSFPRGSKYRLIKWITKQRKKLIFLIVTPTDIGTPGVIKPDVFRMKKTDLMTHFEETLLIPITKALFCKSSHTVYRKILNSRPVSYTHLRAHETSLHLVCRLLLEKS